ncbi:MAG: hypothetical protein EOO15_20775 [Chitinophagaceae bacterium]|nr:MAG: hypothetical protein EOO15_20775 [Chitinophagaceae bacterium]
MNEIILLVLFGALLIGVNIWASRLRMPARAYYRIACSVVLLLLAIFGSNHQGGWPQVVLIVIAAGALVWALFSLLRPKANK